MFHHNKVTFFWVLFVKCLNATIPSTCTLANEYPSSNEISEKNVTVRGWGNFIACDASFEILIFEILTKR